MAMVGVPSGARVMAIEVSPLGIFFLSIPIFTLLDWMELSLDFPPAGFYHSRAWSHELGNGGCGCGGQR